MKLELKISFLQKKTMKMRLHFFKKKFRAYNNKQNYFHTKRIK